MIRSFKEKASEQIFEREKAKGFAHDLQRTVLRKLLMLDAAESLEDLAVPPGNRLEKLKGDRKGQHSIRVNDQYRICFRWTEGGAEDVELVDYH